MSPQHSTRFLHARALAALALAVLCSDAAAGKFNRKLDVGDKAPRWSGLAGTDDKKHGFDDYKKADVLVVVFICNHCPVAKMYEQRLVEFQKNYRGKGVELVAISCSLFPADRMEKMKERAEEKKFNFDYLADPGQQTGRDYGATVTPHVFVLDKSRRVAYMGAFDDSMKPDGVERRYVHDAVEALLAGEKPGITETLQFGCAIEYQEK